MSHWQPEFHLKNKYIILTFSLIISVGINIVLFAFVPYLTEKNPERRAFSEYINPINLVRIKRYEEEIRKKRKKIVQKNELKKHISKKIYISPQIKTKYNFNLPFKINPKLPNISGIIPVQPVTRLNLALGIKGAFAIGEVDCPPIPIFQIPPVYPMSARIKGMEGWVTVRFIVNEDGRVSNIKVIKSYPKDRFDDAVISCVSKWRFRPATVEGIKVKTLVETTIRFKLR